MPGHFGGDACEVGGGQGGTEVDEAGDGLPVEVVLRQATSVHSQVDHSKDSRVGRGAEVVVDERLLKLSEIGSRGGVEVGKEEEHCGWLIVGEDDVERFLVERFES